MTQSLQIRGVDSCSELPYSSHFSGLIKELLPHHCCVWKMSPRIIWGTRVKADYVFCRVFLWVQYILFGLLNKLYSRWECDNRRTTADFQSGPFGKCFLRELPLWFFLNKIPGLSKFLAILIPIQHCEKHASSLPWSRDHFRIYKQLPQLSPLRKRPVSSKEESP